MTTPETKPEAAPATPAVSSGVLYLPPGTTQEPCPFPCSICVRKGRQKAPEAP